MLPADQSLSQSILDTLTSHIAVVEVDGTIIAVNKAWVAFSAVNSPSEQTSTGIGANYLDVAGRASWPHLEEGPGAYTGIKEVLNGSRQEFTMEYPCQTPTEKRWFIMTVSALAGSPRRAVVSHLDITSRRQMENRLRESEDRFRELAQHLRQVLWVIDAKEAKVLYVSPGYEMVWGRSCQSLLDKPHSYLEGIHPDDEEMMQRANTAMYQTGHIDVECRIQRPNGTVAWVWIRGDPVPENGQINRLVGVIEDITERKHTEEVTGRLAAIIEFADDAIVSLTLNGIVISWNEGAERLYGYTAEEMIGRSIIILHPPERHAEYLSVMERTRKGERVAAFETVRRRKDGTLIDVSLSASAIEVVPGHVTGTSKISHDITKMKLLEEQFRQAQKMEAIGTLAGGVAHDFNNLLTVINGYCDLLIGQIANANPMREMLVEIHKAGDRAETLTRQLLAFSRKQMLEPKVLSLNSLVADCEMMLRRLIGEDIILTSNLDPVMKPIMVDSGQVQQVLMNLAVNARDAMPQGGNLTIETRQVELDDSYAHTHFAARPGEYSMVSFSDTGTGMDEATKARIFEPFFTTKEAGRGTGLGMAVVHGVIKQSGGLIEIVSELGQGTTMKVFFPVASEPLSGTMTSIGDLTMPKGTETLMLVEDEDAVRELACRILHACGYKVLAARHGVEAIQVARSHDGPIALVMTDVVMPLMGGVQLTNSMKALRPDMKTLFLSGYTDDAIVRQGITDNTVAFLQKPFSPTSLARKVRDVLDERA